MIKIFTLFLVFIAVLALFGRLRFPGKGRAKGRCTGCGRPLIGDGRCPCGGGA